MTHSDHGRLAGAARAVLEHLPGRSPAGGGQASPVQQTVTLTASAVDVLTALEDPGTLSRLLGELGSVQARGAGQRWTFAGGEGHDGLVWDTALARREDGLRYEGPTGGSTSSIDVTTSPAPRDHGTEVRAVADLPLPRAAAGAAAFTLLYRLRALLVTGEVPTLRPQPSARDERG
ncbi:hypothetical protein FHN55_17940 [Streptomyces sp. NP160]|uniref:hypothetical protein n=1 Tax=Streptomyces sp. NP160 TaxID=2586637 RepID=UPI00111BABFD|nr:hypothetical protein [Streptomyces sp. NP160]TNM60659.1 hypothetical protein FHN55_17940 [Streptomyces sp. NP160]